jgi:hypothetical protein
MKQKITHIKDYIKDYIKDLYIKDSLWQRVH